MKKISLLFLFLIVLSQGGCKIISNSSSSNNFATLKTASPSLNTSTPVISTATPMLPLDQYILAEDSLPGYHYTDVTKYPDYQPGMANPWIVEGDQVKKWYYIPIGYDKIDMENVIGFLSVTFMPDDWFESVGYFVIQSRTLTPEEIKAYIQYLILQQKERFRLFIDGNQLVLVWSNTQTPALQKLADLIETKYNLTPVPIELAKTAQNPFGSFNFAITDEYQTVQAYDHCQVDADCESDPIKQICLKCPNGKLVFSKGCQDLPGITLAPVGQGLCTQEHMLGLGYEGFFNGECMTSTIFCLIPVKNYLVPTVYPEDALKYFPLWLEAILSAPGVDEQYYRNHFLVRSADRYQSSPENPAFFHVGYQFVFDWIDVRQTYTLKIREAGEPDDLDIQLVRDQLKPLSTLEPVSKIITQEQVQAILAEGCYPNMKFFPDQNIQYELENNLLWLRAFGTINEQKNQCKQARINLVTGEILSCEDAACAVP